MLVNKIYSSVNDAKKDYSIQQLYDYGILCGFDMREIYQKIASRYIDSEGKLSWCTLQPYQKQYVKFNLFEHIYRKYIEKPNRSIKLHTYAINRYPKAKSIYLDIDDDTDSISIWRYIKQKLNLEEMLFEINPINNHLHVIFPTDEYYDDEKLLFIKNTLREICKNNHIDIGTTNICMRFPGSSEYITGYFDNNEFIPFISPVEQIEYIKNYKPKNLFSINKLIDCISEKIIPKENSIYEKLSLVSGRYYPDTNTISHNNKINLEYLERYRYGCGNRNENQLRIISYFIRRGETDENVIYEKVMMFHDGTSKDINDLGEQRFKKKILLPMIRDLIKKYDKNKIKNYKYAKDIFTSNICHLELEKNKELNKQIKGINLALKEIFKKTYTKEKRYSIVIKYSDTILKEILGLAIANDKYQRIKNSQFPITNYKFEQLTYGCQFSKKWLKSLCKHYNISGININVMVKIILNYLFVQIKPNERGWSHSNFIGIPNSCKQYIIKSHMFYNENEFNKKYIQDTLTCNRKPIIHNIENIINSLKECIKYNNINNIYIKNIDIYYYNKPFKILKNTEINVLYEKFFYDSKERDVDD